jgi:ABC-type transporter lipoprotein component MlaA
MGDDMPRGKTRVIVNILMGIAALAATGAGVSAVIKKFGEAVAFWGGS